MQASNRTLNDAADAGDVSTRLYRAALGPDPADRYLRGFQARDAGTPPPRRWHWGACVSALGWLAWRGLFALAALWACTALLGTVLVLGLARLLFGADAGLLAALLLALCVLASLAWGLGAERLYHRICTRRILQAVGTHDSIAAACAALHSRQPGRASRGALLLLAGTASLAVLAGLGHALRPAAAPPPAPVAAVAHPPAAAPVPVPVPVPVAMPEAAPAPAAPPPAVPPDEAGAMPPAAPAPPARPAPAARRSGAAAYAVQVGVFAQADNARAVQTRLGAAGLAAQVDAMPGQGHQRVRSGPYASQEQAQRAAERIRALGLPAVVVRLQAARD